MDQFILLILAITPCIGIALFIALDKTYSNVSTNSIMLGIGSGFLSFLLVLGIGLTIKNLAEPRQGDLLYQIVHAMVFVGFIEEGSKFLVLRGILFRRKDFRQPFDGIVYSVMIGMGFALAENLIYLISGQGGALIVRMVTAIPAHAAFAVIMGYFVGEAKVFPTSARLFTAMGLFFAAFAHGYYDFFLLQENLAGLWWHSATALIISIAITYKAIQVRQREDD